MNKLLQGNNLFPIRCSGTVESVYVLISLSVEAKVAWSGFSLSGKVGVLLLGYSSVKAVVFSVTVK